MNYAHKQAFSLFESLVAISVFSFILMLYLPANYQEVKRIETIKNDTHKWRIFYEMVHLQQNSTLNTIEINYPQLDDAVIYFYCDSLSCEIKFSDESVYQIALYEINQIEADE